MLNFAKLCYNQDFCNTYLLGEEGSPCLVIDPGFNENGCLSRYIAKHHDGKILAALLTHGHFDHFAGLNFFGKTDGFPLFMSEDDAPCLEDPKKNASFYLSSPIVLEKEIKPYYVDDGDEIALGPYHFQAMATPFHTKGSVCFYFKDGGILFSGDTLFRLGIGRDDLPWADPRSKRESLEKLFNLPPETKVAPGHGPMTTIGQEKKHLTDYLGD